MTKFFNRIHSFFNNIVLLGPMMGFTAAFAYLVKTQGDSNAIANAKFKGIPFKFRRRDISAVQEVLLKGEYSFLRPVIEKTKNPVILDIGAHIGLFSVWVGYNSFPAGKHKVVLGGREEKKRDLGI